MWIQSRQNITLEKQARKLELFNMKLYSYGTNSVLYQFHQSVIYSDKDGEVHFIQY